MDKDVREFKDEELEDQEATDQRPDRRADGVEALRQVQPAGSGFLRTENGDIGIGCDLQHGEPETNDKQGGKEHRIRSRACRRPEQGTARG